MMNCTADDDEEYQLVDGEDGMSSSSEDVESSGARLNKVMLTLVLGSFWSVGNKEYVAGYAMVIYVQLLPLVSCWKYSFKA